MTWKVAVQVLDDRSDRGNTDRVHADKPAEWYRLDDAENARPQHRIEPQARCNDAHRDEESAKQGKDSECAFVEIEPRDCEHARRDDPGAQDREEDQASTGLSGGDPTERASASAGRYERADGGCDQEWYGRRVDS